MAGTGFWFGAAALILIATGFVLVPLWRRRQPDAEGFVTGPLIALLVIPASVGLYLGVSSYDADVSQSVARSEEMAVLEGLAERLQQNPDDVSGWRLLGRSYRELGDYERARLAFEEAWKRTADPDNALKVNYAETLLVTDPSSASGMAGALLDQVLAESPGDQAALWLGGIAAVESGRNGVAVDRFSALLATNPPPEIAEIIQREIIALGGAGAAPPVIAASGTVLDLEISIADGMPLERFGPGARLFILARGADMPMPIAAKQIADPFAALPGRFELSDADSPMATGRTLGDYEAVTVVARISASGTATQQSGDIYAEATIAPDSGETVRLVIDQVAP